jgi:hypothetical protein
MHKVKKFAPNFDVYVERLDWPTAPMKAIYLAAYVEGGVALLNIL